MWLPGENSDDIYSLVDVFLFKLSCRATILMPVSLKACETYYTISCRQLFVMDSVFVRSGYLLQNHTYWDATCTVGLPKQRQVKMDCYDLLCFGNPTVQVASQYVRLWTMWPDRVKGLSTTNCIRCEHSKHQSGPNRVIETLGQRDRGSARPWVSEILGQRDLGSARPSISVTLGNFGSATPWVKRDLGSARLSISGTLGNLGSAGAWVSGTFGQRYLGWSRWSWRDNFVVDNYTTFKDWRAARMRLNRWWAPDLTGARSWT